MTRLMAGAAKVDITPRTPVCLQGYGDASQRLSDGVRDPLHARAIVLDSNGARCAIVHADMCVLDFKTLGFLRQAVCGPLDIAPECVFVAVTHSHSAPCESYSVEGDGKPLNAEWSDAFRHKLVEAALLAAAAMRPAKLSASRGESRINCCRRQTSGDGTVWLGHAPEKFVDRELVAIHVDAVDGKPIARLIHYGCHNTVCGHANLKITGDWAGAAAPRIEKALGADAVVAILNGGAGDVNPRERGAMGPDYSALDALAGEFATDALAAFSRDPTPCPGEPIRGMWRDVELPRKQAGVEAGRGRSKRLRIDALRFGDVALLGFPGELFSEIVLRLKRETALPHALPCSYVYDAPGAPARKEWESGYLPTAKAWDDGGYEVSRTPFAPEAEDVFTDAALRLVTDLSASRHE